MVSAARARIAASRGRTAAEALMVDHCVIMRVEKTTVGGEDVFTEVPVYVGPCKVTTYEPDAIVYATAGRPIETQEYRLHVPIGVGPIRMGDVATILGYPQPYRIDGLSQKTFATAQRLKITEQANKERR